MSDLLVMAAGAALYAAVYASDRVNPLVGLLGLVVTGFGWVGLMLP